MARPRLSDDSETKRLNMVIAEEQLRDIDDFAARQGTNRSQAVRLLVEMGLDMEWFARP